MSRFRVNTDEGGFTLLEVVVSILIIVIAMGATASYQLMSNRTMQIGKDRVFAIQKAVQMIEELRAYTESSGEHGIRILDSFDNGTSYSTILTTDTLVTAPDDPLSGNRRMGSYWRFCRQVRVTPIGNEARARRTTVRVFYSSGADTSSVERVLAEVSTVMNTIGEAYPPTQAYDMYILALESVPGWWTDMSSMRPMFQSALARIEARNPGLKYRTHWITRMSYGRDSLYTPYSNMDKAPTEQVDWVYFYPGTVNPTEDLQFYVPESFRSRIYIDTMIFHLGSYAVADQFNHAMRYPDELATFDAYEALDPGQ
ncbi:MAG: prepilin-type N-terminal cleavage/methylation domain-containing protein, partial [bacterium]